VLATMRCQPEVWLAPFLNSGPFIMCGRTGCTSRNSGEPNYLRLTVFKQGGRNNIRVRGALTLHYLGRHRTLPVLLGQPPPLPPPSLLPRRSNSYLRHLNGYRHH